MYLNNKYTSHVLECILPFHRIDFWRNSAYWNVLVENEVKAKYVGLENPGCICYHNSLMQQLFMIQDFKSAILALDLREPEEDDKAIESESSDIKETKDSCEGKEQK